MIRSLKTPTLVALIALTGCDDGDSNPAVTDANSSPDMHTASDMATSADMDVDAAIDPDAAVDPDAAMMPDGAPEPEPEPDAMPGSACPDATRVGAFAVSLEAGFTAVQGQIANGVAPATVGRVEAESGRCALIVPPGLFCEPGCEAGEVCGADGCVPAPTNVSVGDITVTGLALEVMMSAGPPVFFYSFRGTLPDPPYAPNAAIALSADGGEHDAFSLAINGVERLELDGTSVPMRMGEPVMLRWTPPSDGAVTEVHVDLNIANHGGTPGRIDCVVPDTGMFAVPVELVDMLLMNGFSGFPSAALTRRSIRSTEIDLGCVQFESRSLAVYDVEIDGLISCSSDDDCPDAQTCQGDLTCG